MAKLYFNTVLNEELWKKFNISKMENIIILEYAEADEGRIRKFLRGVYNKDKTREANNKEPVEMEVKIQAHYKVRSLKANALMWKLYDLYVYILNNESKSMHKITAEDQYKEDMKLWAPRHKIYCEKESLQYMKISIEKDYGHVEEVKSIKNGTMFQIIFAQTSSFWDSRQMYEHICRLKTRFQELSITNDSMEDLNKLFSDIEAWKQKHQEEII